jgi:hypothetical protein
MRVPQGYNAYFFKEFPLDQLVPGTSRMDEDEFTALKESIQEQGMVNPLVIEYHVPEYIVFVGHNRCKVLEELGHTTAPAVVLSRVRGEIVDGGEVIPAERFARTMEKVHPGDDTWTQSCWAMRMLKRARQV